MIKHSIDLLLGGIQHRTNYYNGGLHPQNATHKYIWTKRTAADGDEGLLCQCGFHVRKEWLDEAKAQIKADLLALVGEDEAFEDFGGGHTNASVISQRKKLRAELRAAIEEYLNG